MVFIRILVGIAVFYLITMVSILIHETGHLAGYKITTKRNDWIIKVGIRKMLFGTKRLQFRILPLSGDFLIKTPLKKKKEKILMMAGGPLFTAIFMILLFVLQASIPKDVSNDNQNYRKLVGFMLYCNVWMLTSSIIPMKYLPFIGGQSDGMDILHVLREKTEDAGEQTEK